MLTPRRVDEHHPGGLRHDDWHQKPADQLETEVASGHQPACRVDVASVDEHPICVQRHIGKPLAKMFGIDSVRGGRARSTDPSLPTRRPFTDGGQHHRLAMTFSQPTCQWHCDVRLDRANGESHVGAGQLEVETFETQKGEKHL